MALFTTALGLYGGVLWSGELQGFIIHQMMPIVESWQGQAAGAISVVGKAVLTLYPPLRPLSHNVNPRNGAQDMQS